MDTKNEFNSFSLINYIWQWRKLFIIVCCAAATLSFAASLMIKPQYKATTVIYAPRTNSVSKILMTDNNINERLDIKSYAIEEETEQMMQILNSREIRDILIERYNLADYYGIGTTGKGWKTKLYETIDEYIKIKRTEFGAIAIIVNDWNPEQAANIANDIAAELDTVKNKIEKDRAMAACTVLQNQMKEVERLSEILADTIGKLVKKGVFVYERQVERVMQQHAIALAQGNMAGVQRLQKEMEKLEKWGPASYILRREQENLSDLYSFTKQRLLNAQMDLNGLMPVKFVIEKAIAPDKKSYPKKMVIALLSTIGTFFMLLMILLFMDKIKNEIVIENNSNPAVKKE